MKVKPSVVVPEMRSQGACHCIIHTEAVRQLFPAWVWPDEEPKFDNMTPEQRRNVRR